VSYPEPKRTNFVYVDATISNRQDPELPKEAYVAYVVEGSALRNVKKIEYYETDDAELEAVSFAISELEGKLPRFVILCDHESVVSEINKQPTDVHSENPILRAVRSRLAANPAISVDLFRKNPADTYLKEYLKNRASGSPAVDSPK
jgi:hypothetical protein